MTERFYFRIGNQTAFSAARPMELFEYALANSFDAFEWFPDKKEWGAGWEECDVSGAARKFIRDTASAHDISLSVHAPWQSNPVIPGSWELLLKDIDFARDVGASRLNIHLYTEKGLIYYSHSIVPLIVHLGRLGIKLSIENTPLTGPEEFNDLFKHLHSLTSIDITHVGMCLDIGHANLCESTHNNYLKFVDSLNPEVPIIHVHLHENYGDFDSHLPLFTGPSAKDAAGIRGLVERLEKRRFKGSMILEQWPQPPGLLNEARNRLYEIIGDFEESIHTTNAINGDDFSHLIPEIDRRYRSWREKLEWIRDVICQEAHQLNQHGWNKCSVATSPSRRLYEPEAPCMKIWVVLFLIPGVVFLW